MLKSGIHNRDNQSFTDHCPSMVKPVWTLGVVMYNVAPIQTVGELSQTSDKMTDESAVMARLDALQSRVNTIKSVLAKTPKKTDFGSKFVQKVAPLDIVINVNPAVNSPHGWYYS